MKSRCKRGHKMEGDNLLTRKRANGQKYYLCRACARAYSRQYLRDSRLPKSAGLLTRKKIGLSLEQKLAHFVRVDGDCRIWTGSVRADSGQPQLSHKGRQHSVRRCVWEQFHGPLGRHENVRIIATGCQHPKLCVADVHIMKYDVREVGWNSSGHRLFTKPREILLSAFDLRRQVIRMLKQKFPSMRNDFDDIAQDAFLRIYEAASFRGTVPESVFSFLVVSSKRIAIDLQRSRRWCKTVPIDMVSGAPEDGERAPLIADPEEQPDSVLQSEQQQAVTARLVRSLLGRITRRQRQVITLQMKGLSQREIAEALGMREHTVECHLVRARQKLLLAKDELYRRWNALKPLNPGKYQCP